MLQRVGDQFVDDQPAGDGGVDVQVDLLSVDREWTREASTW